MKSDGQLAHTDTSNSPAKTRLVRRVCDIQLVLFLVSVSDHYLTHHTQIYVPILTCVVHFTDLFIFLSESC